jgi:predicted regulator of Ras-like GTPase activity (Roadblock/LC7/MglB family)
MSAFRPILESMVKAIPGAVGAVFADWEGEPVDQFAHIAPLEIQLVGAHWGVVFSAASACCQKMGGGGAEEMWIEGEGALVLVRRVAEQYYVVLATKREAHLGTARRALERSAALLLEEM